MVNINRIETWFQRMEQLGQADIPMEFGGIVLTPRQLLQHATANDNVFKQVQPYLPM